MAMSVADSAVVLLFHFDEASGNFVDSSAARRVLTKSGSPSSSSSSKFGANCYQGPASQAGSEGVDIAAFASSGLSAPGGSIPYTVDLWVFPTTTPSGSSQCLFCLGTFGSQHLFLGINTAGKLQLYTTDDSNAGTTINGATTIPLNQWSHVAACRDATGTTRIFVNGVIDGSSASMNSKSTLASGSVVFGYSYGSTGRSYTGRADEFRYVWGLAYFSADFSASLPSAAYPTPAAAKDTGVLTAGPRARQSPLFASVTSKLLAAPSSLKDLYDGGRGRVRGVVKQKGLPSYAVRREVRLIRELDARCIRSQWSDPVTGAFDFTHVDETIRYTVLVLDYTHGKRAVVADNYTPEFM